MQKNQMEGEGGGLNLTAEASILIGQVCVRRGQAGGEGTLDVIRPTPQRLIFIDECCELVKFANNRNPSSTTIMEDFIELYRKKYGRGFFTVKMV